MNSREIKSMEYVILAGILTFIFSGMLPMIIGKFTDYSEIKILLITLAMSAISVTTVWIVYKIKHS